MLSSGLLSKWANKHVCGTLFAHPMSATNFDVPSFSTPRLRSKYGALDHEKTEGAKLKLRGERVPLLRRHFACLVGFEVTMPKMTQVCL
ncbi:hypothetical protein AWB83_02331 [Caballeronia ptereochthonis]|uniref:Uncharacterized protein n=1 Tax=Caballeronia ptereochthonis TaxID=1777144 RepID=A0A158ATI2_9BURK|nr:hypothetical protein AWB83_02331 [Caballeronia ptereochthonis]